MRSQSSSCRDARPSQVTNTWLFSRPSKSRTYERSGGDLLRLFCDAFLLNCRVLAHLATTVWEPGIDPFGKLLISQLTLSRFGKEGGKEINKIRFLPIRRT